MTSSSPIYGGQTLSGVISAGNLISSSFNVSDNSALVNFRFVTVGGSLSLMAFNVAGCGSIVGSAQAGPCEVGVGIPSLTVTGLGRISGSGQGINVLAASLNGRIINQGEVEGNATGIRFVPGATLSGGLTNTGLIQGLSAAGIVLASTAGTGSVLQGGLSNVGGTITALNTGLAIAAGSRLEGGLINAGLINGTSSAGLLLAGGDLMGGVDNASSGTITGSVGLALRSGATLAGGLSNAGLIRGEIKAIAMANSAISGGIINSGSIGAGQSAISIVNSSLTGGINNSGAIVGGRYGLFIDPSMVNGGITNSGLLQGTSLVGVLLSASTVNGGVTNLAGGTITGGNTGLSVTAGGAINGAVMNAGLISGSRNAIATGNTSGVIDSIVQSGNGQFQGDIAASNAGMTVAGAMTQVNAIDVATLNILQGATLNYSSGIIVGDARHAGITGNLFNAGNLNVGGNQASLVGNFAQAATGAFVTALTGGNNAGRLAITGSANLSGAFIGNTSVRNLAPTITGLITATNGLSGRFSSVVSNNPWYRYTADYNGIQANAFSIKVTSADFATNVVSGDTPTTTTTETSSPTINPQPVHNPAARGVARMLDSNAMNAGNLAGVYNQLTNLYSSGGSQAVSNALSQTLPVVVGASSMATLVNSRTMTDIVQARLSAQRGLSSGEGFYGNNDVWLKGFGTWTKQGELNNVAGYNVNTGGLAIGMDHKLTDEDNIGVMYSYANSGANSNGQGASSSMNINSYSLRGYGDHAFSDTLNLNYTVGIGMSDNTEYRNLSLYAGTPGVTGTRAQGNYNSWNWHVGAGLQQLFTLQEGSRLIPQFRVDYYGVQSNAYTETGAGVLNLVNQTQSFSQLLIGLDLRFDQDITDRIKGIVNGGVKYNALDNSNQIISSFQGGGTTFATDGLRISPWYYHIGGGLVNDVRDDVQLSIRYDAILQDTNFFNQTLEGRVRWSF